MLEQITDRLGDLIHCDNIAIEVVDRAAGILVPLTARGVHAEEYLAPWEPGETGIATWVVEHNEPVLIADERTDDRVNHFRDTGAIDGSLIVVPLLGPDRRRRRAHARAPRARPPASTSEEFELVKLFAAQVSIALRNAETFQAAEIRARTDDLTGLLNHGTFQDWLARSVASAEPFGLVMVDLDEFKTVNDTLRATRPATGSCARSPARSRPARATRTPCSATAATSSSSSCRAAMPTACGTVAERITAAVAGVGGEGSSGGPGTSSSRRPSAPPRSPPTAATAEDVLLAADRACFVAKRSRPRPDRHGVRGSRPGRRVHALRARRRSTPPSASAA